MPRGSKISDVTRRKIAAKVASGATEKQVMDATGLSRSAVARQKKDPRTRSLITTLKAEHEPQLAIMYRDSIDAIHSILKNKFAEDSSRIRAALATMQIITAGDAPTKAIAPPGKGDFLYTDLLRVEAAFTITATVVPEE